MIPWLVRRLAQGALVVALVAVTTFSLLQAAPGGPSLLADPKLSNEERAAVAAQLGVDQPVAVQFSRWISHAVRGDLGRSFLYQTPTVSAIASRLPATLMLASAALVLSVLVGVGAGTMAAARPASVFDRAAGTVAVAVLSVPAFWLGMVLILLFAVTLGWLPSGGAVSDIGAGGVGDRLRHLILPAIVLAAAGAAELFRYTRTSVREALTSAFARTGRAKGLTPRRVVWRHALRHALVTVTSLVGLQLPRLVGGAAITETVFSWPGMGRLGIEAALARDYPLVLGVTLVVSAGVVIASIVVDVTQRVLDPRAGSA